MLTPLPVRLRPTFALTALTAAALACGEAKEDPPPTDGGTVDSGSPLPDAGTPDSGVVDSGPPPCHLNGVPAALDTSAGGRVVFTPESPEATAELTINAPDGWRVTRAAGEVHVRVPYGVEGHFPIDVAAQCGSASAEAAIDVTIRPLRFGAAPAWSGGVDGPSAREHTLLMIDPATPDRLHLYGGFGFVPRQFTLVTDFWEYDLVNSTWRTLTSSRAPALAGGRVARIEGSDHAVVMGGSDQAGNAELRFDELRVVGGQAVFTPLSVTGTAGAQATQLGSWIWDAPRSRFISACGISTRDIHCEIGAYDPANGSYQVLQPNNGIDDRPDPRYGFFAAHDTENDRLVIFSGARFPRARDPVNAAQDLWALLLHEEPVRWVKLSNGDPNVPGRRNGCSAYDPIGQRFFVWGGTSDQRTTQPGLFAIDLELGHEGLIKVDLPSERPVRSSCSAIYDPARRRILFGFGNSADIYADFAVLEL